MSASPPESSPDRRALEHEAAAWAVREDRGLTAAEQDALSQWLAASPAHRAALAERRWAWREFDRVAGLPDALATAPDPDLLAPRRRTYALPLAVLGVAAAAVVLWLDSSASRLAGPAAAVPALSTALAAPCETRTLGDGTVVELNRGARLAVDFSPGLRRVQLERGEAHFAVAKDPARPFVVEAAGVAVRAVGTAFNVRLAAAEVEVIVAEGTVAVARDATSEPPLLTARQRVVVLLREAGTSPVTTLSADDLVARLAWQPRLLDFSDLPLATAIEQLNRHNPVQLTLGTPALRERRVNASIRSDNVEGFVRLLESALDLRAEWRSETEIVLYPVR